MAKQEIALIVGAGSGLSASLARLCAKKSMELDPTALLCIDCAKFSGRTK